MANRTFDTVLKHFSFVHIPTFRLIDTAACLAFAISTVGGIRSGKQRYDYASLLQRPPVKGDYDPQGMDGPVPPGQTWESIYKANYLDGVGDEDEDARKVEGWENGPIVRNEKTNMLVKVGKFHTTTPVKTDESQSFSLAQGVLMTEYNVALLQALVLYNAPYFLSEDENERQLANMFLGTIVNVVSSRFPT